MTFSFLYLVNMMTFNTIQPLIAKIYFTGNLRRYL
jgi:hypothetical protein